VGCRDQAVFGLLAPQAADPEDQEDNKERAVNARQQRVPAGCRQNPQEDRRENFQSPEGK
jgi:hypothetical protein